MGFPVIRISKFVGTISLGLLTGVSYTLSNISLPALLHLPTAPLAQATHAATHKRARRAQRILAATAAAAFSAAYLLSPRRAKHPYLLYCAILAGAGSYCDGARAGAVGSAWARFVGGRGDEAQEKKGVRERRSNEGLGESGVMVGQSSSASEADEEDAEAGVNGEMVRRQMEEGVRAERVRMGVWGLGFFFSVLGLWGDLL